MTRFAKAICASGLRVLESGTPLPLDAFVPTSELAALPPAEAFQRLHAAADPWHPSHAELQQAIPKIFHLVCAALAPAAATFRGKFITSVLFGIDHISHVLQIS